MPAPSGSLIIRAANSDEAGEVARLHADSWRSSYAGILPDRYLQHEVGAERGTYWSRAFQNTDYAMVLLALLSGEPAGFIALKTGSEPGYDATIEHLHVAAPSKGLGLGSALIACAVAALRQQDLQNICLRVFEDNTAAIRFYERLGGVTDQHGIDRLAGSDARDRRIGWQDLAALERACISKAQE